jgi:hypothetical protein
MSAFTFKRSLLVAVSAAATLTLAATPAAADSNTLERIEIRGRIVEAAPRYDVHAACAGLQEQLLHALGRTWFDEGRYGEVKVQMVLENGRVDTVKATGISGKVARKVRAAVHRLECTRQDTADAEIYRFSVDFIDPDAPASSATRLARTRGVRVTL